MDLNFAKGDGSVARQYRIDAAGDDRMERVPVSLNNSTYAGWWVQIPKE